MFSEPAVSRKTPFWIAGLSFLFIACVAHAQPVQDCAEALQTPGGALSLIEGTTATQEKKVDEWESDIVKVVVPGPGLVVLSGEGTSAEASLYAGDPASAAPQLVDGSQVGTSFRPLTAVVRPGEHCVQVTPPAGATGSLRLRINFFDVCHLGPQDDHGDSFLCATEIGLGETRTGNITAADHDLFSFVLTAPAGVTIAATLTAGLSAGLYDEEGALLAADARGSRTLSTGRYFVRIEGPEDSTGTYGLTITDSSH